MGKLRSTKNKKRVLRLHNKRIRTARRKTATRTVESNILTSPSSSAVQPARRWSARLFMTSYAGARVRFVYDESFASPFYRNPSRRRERRGRRHAVRYGRPTTTFMVTIIKRRIRATTVAREQHVRSFERYDDVSGSCEFRSSAKKKNTGFSNAKY